MHVLKLQLIKHSSAEVEGKIIYLHMNASTPVQMYCRIVVKMHVAIVQMQSTPNTYETSVVT